MLLSVTEGVHSREVVPAYLECVPTCIYCVCKHSLLPQAPPSRSRRTTTASNCVTTNANDVQCCRIVTDPAFASFPADATIPVTSDHLPPTTGQPTGSTSCSSGTRVCVLPHGARHGARTNVATSPRVYLLHMHDVEYSLLDASMNAKASSHACCRLLSPACARTL